MTAEARSLAKQPIAGGEGVSLPGGAFLQVSGIGRARAFTAARAALEKGATALMSWGIAGGLSPDLPPGSLILPKMIIGADRSGHPSDLAWHASLCSRLEGYVDFHTETLAESTTALRTAEEKASLYRQTGAFAVDMESGAVAAVAQSAGVPFVAIRAIADSAGTEIPRVTLQAFDEFGQLNLLGLLNGLTHHPSELPALIRLGLHFCRAQTTLMKVAKRIGGDWALP
jgi:adenosylhomocysteine nucleosidase